MRATLLPSTLLTLALATTGCDSCSKPLVAGADAAAPAPTTIADAGVMNVTPVPTASVERLLNPDKLPAYAGATGSVEGTISVTGDPAAATPADFSKCPDAAKMYGHAFREGEPKTPGGPRWLADAVVAVTGYSGFFLPAKNEAEELTIKDCAFTRRTVTMTFGQRLEVKNLTKEFWTPVLEQPGSKQLMLMATPGGDAVKLYPKVPGHFHLVDHDRKYALVDVYAFLHSLHTSSAVLGTYRIDGVPVGKRTVNTSHPAIHDVTAQAEVTVEQGVVHRVDLVLQHKKQDAGAPVDAGGGYPRLH